MKKVLIGLMVITSAMFAATDWFVQTDFDGFNVANPVIGYNLDSKSYLFGMLLTTSADYYGATTEASTSMTFGYGKKLAKRNKICFYGEISYNADTNLGGLKDNSPTHIYGTLGVSTPIMANIADLSIYANVLDIRGGKNSLGANLTGTGIGVFNPTLAISIPLF